MRKKLFLLMTAMLVASASAWAQTAVTEVKHDPVGGKGSSEPVITYGDANTPLVVGQTELEAVKGKTVKVSATPKAGWKVVGVKAKKAAAGPVANVTLDASTTDVTLQDGDVMTGTGGANTHVTIADGATVTLKDVDITGILDDSDSHQWAGITCAGDATIILSGTNAVKGGYNEYPGIYVPVDKTLTIQGDGSLDASSNGYAAGIGGGDEKSCGNIVIEGGTITATGGESHSAGIGSGNNAACGYITISGGNITATGAGVSAGIGCGRGSAATCGAITISGGTIVATGAGGGAGIGGGGSATCGNITITSGVTSVTATKGNWAPNSIGAGYDGTCGTVTIEDESKVTQN